MNILKVVTLSTLMLFASMELWARATNSNPLSDIRVRHAVAYAIDMETIRDTSACDGIGSQNNQGLQMLLPEYQLE